MNGEFSVFVISFDAIIYQSYINFHDYTFKEYIKLKDTVEKIEHMIDTSTSETYLRQ